ncbi:MAG: alpha/beta hydrolase [Deltaproteobacteria bacterium]|nr:alpha/beta hydrolase [Deltaproteobacteria bacterium]
MERSCGQEITLEIPGLRVAAKVWGPADGLHVLGVHGWLDNASTFDLLAPLLPGVRLVAIDLPGHGRSDHRPPGHAYHLIDYIRDVHSILDALEWDTVSLLGHSMGGGIACMVAGTSPERVERLALLEALAPLTTEPSDAPTRLADGIRNLRKFDAKVARTHPDRESMVSRLRQASPGMSEEAARVLVQRASIEVPGGFCWRSDPRLRLPSLFRLTRGQVYAFLDRVVCPSLIVRATHGFPFDQEEARAQLKHIKDARVVEVDGSHHVHLDYPARVAEVLELFFASTRRESARSPGTHRGS